MLSAIGTNAPFRYVVTVLTMAAVFAWGLAAPTVASGATEMSVSLHHGHVHGHAHGHDHPSDPLASGEESSAPHSHVIAYMSSQYVLPWFPAREIPQPGGFR